jgi:DNA-binding response OmpR family regulator
MNNGPLILVVDDEDNVRTIAEAMLSRSGYRVALAADGIEALTLHERTDGEVRAVLLDWTLPLLDGEGVLRELRRRDASLPIILCSGAVVPPENLEGVPGAAPLVLTKPYRMAQLLATVAQAVGS